MAWLKLIIESDKDDAEALSDALLALGAGSVSLADGADQPLFEPPPGETPLWSATRVIALFPADTDTDAVFDALPAGLGAARRRVEALEDRDWTRAWMDHFEPMRFGERLWVVPEAFEPPDASALNIRLDPGLAFGTGTHPTTALCLEWLDANPPAGGVVVDYGCGSGILALAAAKLGAERVVCVDNDPQALMATRDNARRNAVDGLVEVYAPDSLPDLHADLVLANILAGPLVGLYPVLDALMRPGGALVLSGLLVSQVAGVANAYRPTFADLSSTSRGDWARLSGRRL